MAIKEYTTSYSGANPTQDADPITGVQPDLADESAVGAGDGDEARSSHPETLRDKLQATAKMAGDSANSPSGSLAEIIDRDHANGDARQVRLRERATDPTNVADKGFIYTKDVSSATEFFYLDSAGNAVQITSGGSLAGGGGGSGTPATRVRHEPTSDVTLPAGSPGAETEIFSLPITVGGTSDVIIVQAMMPLRPLITSSGQQEVSLKIYDGATILEKFFWKRENDTVRSFDAFPISLVYSITGLSAGAHTLTIKGQTQTTGTGFKIVDNGNAVASATIFQLPSTLVDTPLPTLTHSGVSQVDAAASPGNNSTIRLTLQDGKQRTYTGTVSFDPSTGAVDGGLDTGTEASSTWYYLYLVPSSGDDNVLHIRGSVTAPTTGPTGYTNWRYVGAVYNDSGSDIRMFHQHGSKFLKPRAFVSLGTTPDAGPVSHSVASQYLPATAYAIVLDLYIDSTTGSCTLQAWPDGSQAGANWALSYCKGPDDSNTTYYEIPTPTTPKVLYFKKTGTAIAGSGYSSLGWVDGWLSRA